MQQKSFRMWHRQQAFQECLSAIASTPYMFFIAPANTGTPHCTVLYASFWKSHIIIITLSTNVTRRQDLAVFTIIIRTDMEALMCQLTRPVILYCRALRLPC